MEMFEVSHIMSDLVAAVEDNNQLSLLNDFYKEKITDEVSIQEIKDYKNNNSYSCLRNLQDEEFDKFTDYLYN